MLLNGDDPLSNDTLVWSSKNVSATGKLQAKYMHYCLSRMPEGPKLINLDKVKVNETWQTCIVMMDHDCDIQQVAAYLTSIGAGPDDRFSIATKTGTGYARVLT